MALNIFTIAPDADFAAELVKAVLAGFPLADGAAAPPLERFTILVPNRRTAQALREAFLLQAATPALLLPRIRPIGDLDDDVFDAADEEEAAGDAMSPVAQHFALIRLVHEWIAAYPHLPLAETLLRSPAQVQALARSLASLIDSLDIEEQTPGALRDAFNIEVAAHQEAIVSLLGLVHRELPALLHRQDLISRNRHRSLMIRRSAEALLSRSSADPVIAAGSTGSIPATRHLLKTIASLPHGAVVLPGLDTSLDDECWKSVSAQHPQFAMKQLLAELEVSHRNVELLGAAPGARAWLASELMRPSETTHEWAAVLPRSHDKVAAALAGIDMMECRDSEEEAAALATLIRLKLDEGGRRIALVTPDPTMARRVSAQLARWEIVPENSAGEPLNGFGAGRFMRLLLDLALQPGSVAALAALLHHPAVRFGHDAADAARLAGLADMTLLRAPLMMLGLEQIPQLIERLPEAMTHGLRPPEQAAKPASAEWDQLCSFARDIHQQLSSLLRGGRLPLRQQLEQLIELAQGISAGELWMDEAGEQLFVLVEALAHEGRWLPDVTLPETAALLNDYMQRTPLRTRRAATPGISIVGLLEARLQSFDCVLLAGLSESVWPGAADSGPWLNRPMREELKIKQPEASIGQMAHDFVQSLGARHVVLSWSRTEASQPLTPSRWVLRLEALLKGAGAAKPLAAGEQWRAFASMLEKPLADVRIEVPAPVPPLAARLRKLSITQVDRLIDDPYAVYASDILKLKPLEDLSEAGSYALRGQILHLALSIFFKQHDAAPPADMEDALLTAGEEAFRLLPEAAVVRNSWWPRFVRVAKWLAGQRELFYPPGAKLYAEATLASDIALPGGVIKLSGRADLIRTGADRSAAIFDFKSGRTRALKDLSEDFSYQLTLEAAIIEKEGFAGRKDLQVSTLAYVKISGGIPPGEVKPISDATIAESGSHLSGLAQLLSDYMAEDQPFLPHANATAKYAGYYDHLSRYREWSLRGAKTP